MSAAGAAFADSVIGCGGLLAANHNLAVTVISVASDWAIEAVNLSSRAALTLATFAQLGFTHQGPVGAALSSDGSEVAVGGDHKIVLVSVPSGSTHPLASDNAERWLMPLLWTGAGIIANETGYEEIGGDLVRVDPQSGAISPLNSNAARSLSADGRLMAYATYVDLGDGESGGQGPWDNSLHTAILGGADTEVDRQRSRNFLPLDLSTAGELLFESDTGPLGSAAPDMGVYVTGSGRVVQQLPLHFYGEWGSGRLLNASTALVARIVGGGLGTETGVELDLLHLCAPAFAAGCHATTSVVSSIPGGWPTEIGQIVVVGPPG